MFTIKTVVKNLCALLVLGALITSSPTYAEDIVIIVNPDSGVTSLSKTELGRIFLGKSGNFPNGKPAKAVNQIMASQSRKSFDSGFLGKTESQIKSYWSKQMFSGSGTPPEELNGDLDVLKKVASDASIIGYIDASALNDSVVKVEIR